MKALEYDLLGELVDEQTYRVTVEVGHHKVTLYVDKEQSKKYRTSKKWTHYEDTGRWGWTTTVTPIERFLVHRNRGGYITSHPSFEAAVHSANYKAMKLGRSWARFEKERASK